METCGEHFLKIIPILFVVSTLFAMSVCQNEIAQVYNEEDYFYDKNYGSIIGNEDDDDDDDDFQSPALAELGTDISAKKTIRQATKCDENQLMTYLAELQVTNPESLLMIASYKDLENLCRRLAGNLDSINSYMQTCTPLERDHLYMQLIAGLRILNSKLCIESDYLKNFKNYLSCFRQLHTEYVDCAGPADWTENMDRNELCKEYKLISDCYYTKSAMLCGLRAAKIMKDLVVGVVNEIIGSECTEVRKNPAVSNVMPENVFSKASDRGLSPSRFLVNLNHVLGSMRKLLYKLEILCIYLGLHSYL